MHLTIKEKHMDAITLSSIKICPINFKLFAELTKKTNDPEATLLFSKLKFHLTNSKIKKSGKVWIVRSRKQIASWFGFSTKKTDRLLKSLEEQGLIEKNVGLWYGKKRLFINTSEETNAAPVNQTLLKILISTTGSVRSALIFSRIAYSFANSRIQHLDKKWCCLKKQKLADWAGLSIRTIDTILDGLTRKGLVLKKNFLWDEKIQTHFHIPDFTIDLLESQFQKIERSIEKQCEKSINTQNCLPEPAKKGLPIIIRTNTKKTNNKTSTIESQNKYKSDIIFNSIGKVLTQRQLKYLEVALKNTLKKSTVQISSPKELWEQLKFSILNPQQHKNTLSFKHSVSRCMKILSDGNWLTPKGFNNHSEFGRRLKKQREQQRKKTEEEQHNIAIKNTSFIASTKATALTYKSSFTETAVNLTKRLNNLIQEAKITKDNSTIKLIDFITVQIQSLIHQGADQRFVSAALKTV